MNAWPPAPSIGACRSVAHPRSMNVIWHNEQWTPRLDDWKSAVRTDGSHMVQPSRFGRYLSSVG